MGALLLLLVSLGLLTPLAGQPVTASGLPPEVILMARIKEKMAINLARLPNYTCVQTVERSERRAPAKRVRVVDTLRLEVAMVNGNEMYSWPGASGFEEKDLRKVVPTGTIGNGAFGLHARSVFLSGLPIMTYAGDEELDGEMLVRYDYKVGSIGSGYTLRVGAAEGTVPYHGSFWAHPETHDLVRLDVIADVIPPHIPVQSAHKTMEYARVVIGASSFLLPRRALLKLVDLAGNEHRNEMHFSDCRQYSGESFISFGEPPPLEETAPVEAEIIKLPTGLLLNLKLDAGFQAGETMVGDVVTATVRSRVRRKKEVIVPKGARATGRLVHLNKMEGRVEYYTLAIRLDTLEFDNKRAPLSVELESVGSPFGGGASMNPNFPGATIEVNPHIEDQPNVGVFYVQTGRLSVSPGLAMQWRTTE